MEKILQQAFTRYPAVQAPFLHRQYAEWVRTKPLQGLRIAHHFPLVQNTLLKIACLAAGGAEVTVTNPDFMQACPQSLDALKKNNITFVSDMQTLAGSSFDIYLDCGAVLYNTLGAPEIGAIELTGTGDQIYRSMTVACPVISVDRTLTKQLETIFGTAVSAMQAMTLLSGSSLHDTSWLVFGFGKIGRGLAYLCEQKGYNLTVVDICPEARKEAAKLNIKTIAANDVDAVGKVLAHTDVVVTATGGRDVLSAYPAAWFHHKILANMGIHDEFGPRFSAQEILYAKQPINFSLNDPTPIIYIDPEMYVHNQVTLDLLAGNLSHQVHNMRSALDNDTISQWCDYHAQTREEIERWFIQFQAVDS